MTSGDSTQRVEFTSSIRAAVARKAMYVCSNPDCLRVTGFETSKGKPRAIAQVAHILPAASNGPRRDDIVQLPGGDTLTRGDERNAIWLCMPCHYRADSDEEAFPPELLLKWKRAHERRISELVDLDLERSLLKLGEVRMSHDLSREMLLWLDGHRFMYFHDSREMPDYVWRAVEALRVKLVDVRARVFNAESSLGRALAGIQTAVDDFISALNDVRVDEIVVTSGEPNFERFSRALAELRLKILVAVQPIAEQEGFRFTNIPLGLYTDDEVGGFRQGITFAGQGEK